MGSTVQVLAILTFKATALVAFAYVLVLAMRKRPAASRHMVWSLTAAGLLLLPLLSVGLPKWRVAVLPEYSLAVLARPSSADAPAVTKAAQPPDQRPAHGGSRTVRALPVLKSWSLEQWVLFLWMGGAGIVLLKLLVGAARIRRWTRQAVAVYDTAWAQMAGDLGRQLGLRSPVRLRESEAAMMPMALGLFRPTILLPRDANSWPEQRVRLVLLHELAHVKRWDCLMQLVTQAACAVYWFHPLVWLAARESTKERERACDDMVLTQEPAAPDYAQHLLEVARSMRAVRFAWSAVSMARRSQLEGRLLAILDGGHLRHSLSRNAVFGLAIAAAVLLLPLAAFVPQSAGAASQEPNDQLSQADRLCLDEQVVQAEDLYKKALEEAESRPAPETEQAAVRDRLVTLWLSQDKFDPALALADSYQKRGGTSVAESLYRRVLAWRELRSGVMHPDLASSVEKLAALSRRTGNPLQARILEYRLQQIQRTAAVRLGPELSSLRRSEAEFHAGEDYSKAETFYLRSFTTRLRLLGLDDPEVGTTLDRIVYFQAKQGRMTEAEATYQRALPTKIASFGGYHGEVATTMELYAELLAEEPRKSEAKPLNGQAKEIRALRTLELWGSSPSPSAEKAGGAVQSPRLRVKAEPEYTEAARIAKREGTAVFRVEVAPDGRIHNAELLRSAGMGLDEMASAALLKWRFQPGTKDGQPVLVQATIEVNFRLL